MRSWGVRANDKFPDRQDEALATLVRVRRVPADDPRVRLELLEIKAATLFERESLAARFPGVTSKFGLAMREYKELFVVRHLNRRLIIACLLQVIQQFTGINVRLSVLIGTRLRS